MSKRKLGNATTVKRVFIVDDHPVVREGLVAHIRLQSDLEVCGEAGDVAEAVEHITAARPDVAVIDIALKTGSGIDLIKRIRAADQKVRILVWSMYNENIYAERALRAGAEGFVNKGQPTSEILAALRAVLAGDFYASGAIRQRLIGRFVGRSKPVGANDIVQCLSDRELQTFQLIGQGLTTKQIAENMQVSAKTVETYRAQIKKKLNVSNASQLIQHATQWILETGV
jgi:DNA-binding NarL/FixJ family response regulator